MGAGLVSVDALIGRQVHHMTPVGFVFDGGALIFGGRGFYSGWAMPGGVERLVFEEDCCVDSVDTGDNRAVGFHVGEGAVWLICGSDVGSAWLDGRYVRIRR